MAGYKTTTSMLLQLLIQVAIFLCRDKILMFSCGDNIPGAAAGGVPGGGEVDALSC